MSAIDLAIVTSCTGYGEYLEEWAASILAQSVPPAFVGILTHGTEADRAAGEVARALLKGGGLHVKHRHVEWRLDYGVARNAAVAMASTTWVMHLDADDVLFPYALAEVAPLMPEADVVAMGYQRFGERHAGITNTRKTYRPAVGAEALASRAPASGVSPFRRALWERSPYRTDLLGGWDTALWLGFAHLGARFAATRRPVFGYRQHGDSIFLSRLRTQWLSERVGARLQSLRRGDAGVSVVVPIAPDGAERDRAWAWMQRRYAALFPGWQVCTGEAPAFAWRKGDAVANALTKATGDILVVADADCVVDAEALAEGVRMVAEGEAPWVVPHTHVHRLSPAASLAFMADPGRPVGTPSIDVVRRPYRGLAGGGLLIVRRSDYVAVGGIPRQFVGWGGEDEALAVILDTLIGDHVRLPFDLVHLWHEPQAGREGPQARANRSLWSEFARHRGNPDRLWGMVRGGSRRQIGIHTDPLIRHRTTGARGTAIRDEAQTMIRDSFAEQRLEDQRNRRTGTMGTPFDLKKAQRQATMRSRQEQAARNEEAYQTRPHRADIRRDDKVLASVIGKQRPADSVANKMRAGEEVKAHADGDVRFASKAAEEKALEANLSKADLEGLMAEAGPRGITVAQVEAFVE